MTMNDYRELLLGCGNSRERRILCPGVEYHAPWKNLTTLDIDPECDPDIVFDLSTLIEEWIPDKSSAFGEEQFLQSDTFDEIHAYEVLEHCGAQGDYKLFFAQFREFWRVLKPGGYFCATVPNWNSIWAWGDPSHTRVISKASLVFLSKAQYAHQVGRTAMSDFRSLMGDMDFEIVRTRTIGEQFEFVLRAIK